MQDLWRIIEKDRDLVLLLEPGQWHRAALLLVAVAVTIAVLRPLAGGLFTTMVVLVGVLGVQYSGTIVIGVVIALIALLARAYPRRPGMPPPARDVLFQFGVLGGGFVLYLLGRLLTVGTWEQARANGIRLLELERILGLAFEDDMQRLALRVDGLTALFGQLYSYYYLATLCGIAIWLYLVDRREYRIMRDSLGISAVLAVVVIGVLPMAPPRLLPESGVVDTVVAVEGRSHLFVNEYAAVPSLHAGWMALAGLALARSIGGWKGVLIGLLPVMLTVVTVIVTGNHYFLDCVIGSVLALVPAAIMFRAGSTTAPVSLDPVIKSGARAGRAVR